MKIGIIQQKCSSNRSESIAASEAGIRKAASKGSKLAILPELHASQYFCQTENPDFFDLAETIPGPSTEYFGKLARKLKIVLVISLFEKRAPGLYHNTAVVIEKTGRIAGKYRKMHIPDDPGYYEKYYFAPGDLGFNPIETSVGKLGVMVCWDQWYPEAARLMALAGADMLIYPTAIGWDPSVDKEEQQRQIDSWVMIQRSHAIANGIPVISVNRVGFEPSPSGKKGQGIKFWGNSFIAGQQGEMLAAAGTEEEEVIVTDVDLGRTEKVRRNWPFLRDRRIDCFSDLCRRFRK
ncbi:MAG TPA: acyltransferase [Lentisphaeria bacterium]|nr:MAG: acyltransferase [Lentisphaerae bacterium GWF2_50_93]HCE45069.1 acyltransferase [Lentisphaeria bacterium]